MFHLCLAQTSFRKDAILSKILTWLTNSVRFSQVNECVIV